MKAKPVRYEERDGKTYQVQCEPKEATHVLINMPGPIAYRNIPVVHGNATRAGTNCWSWNGDTEKPTLKPSILTKGKRPITDEEYERLCRGEKIELPDVVCHSFVNDGQVKFLNDCTHEFAGKTMDLLEVDV